MATKKTGPAAGPSLVVIEGEVVEVLPSLGLAHFRGNDGLVYGLRPRTPGIDWTTLREGQRFRCWVTSQLHRVLVADVVDNPRDGGRPRESSPAKLKT